MKEDNDSESDEEDDRVCKSDNDSTQMMKRITLELKKKTLHQVYNQVMMCEELGFRNFSKAEPINKLMKEIRKQVKKQTRLTKKQNNVNIVKELLDFETNTKYVNINILQKNTIMQLPKQIIDSKIYDPDNNDGICI